MSQPRTADGAQTPPAAPTGQGFLALHRQNEHGALWLASEHVRAHEFRTIKQADGVLHAAQELAQRMLEAQQHELQTQLAQARRDGFDRGRREGMAAVLGTLALERRMRELFASRMADIIEQCMKHMLGDIGAAELFRQRVLHLLMQADRTAVMLHVSPAQAHWAHAAVQPLADASGDLSWLVILTDSRLAPDSMVLETRTGFVDASIELSLAGMRELVAEAVSRASLRTSLGVAADDDGVVDAIPAPPHTF